MTLRESSMILLLCFLVTVTTQAANFNGTLAKLNSQMAIKLGTTGKKVQIKPANPEIEDQLNKLKITDFISIEGTQSPENDFILVKSLNYVGLKDLIGKWAGDDGYCYSFLSFSEMAVYTKNKRNRCDYAASVMAYDFTYTVNPATTNWLMLVTDTSESYILELTLNSKSYAELSLYDTVSGDIVREIKLRR